MPIEGFIINGEVKKYDYPALDNLPPQPSGGGLTDDIKEALLQLASKVAYIDADGQDYYNDLYDALYTDYFTVTNNLTSVTNSNTTASIAEGASYSATLSCAADYEITSVTITMGGVDVTGTSYSSGTISIANVTGNIVITAVATQRQATLSSITAVFSQGSAVIHDTDSLDILKQYLTVTANWSDTTTSTVPPSDYTLSGTLTVGTATITVSYSGKTDTFSVTVTALTLDDIAYGSLTYRDIFVTGNLVTIGSFEGSITLSSTEQNLGNNNYLKINAGSPSITTDYYVSPTHSLKAFGSSSQQIRFRNSSYSVVSGTSYFACCAVYAPRKTAGNCGVQINLADSATLSDGLDVTVSAANATFESAVGIQTATANKTGIRAFIGTYSSANADCYVDDVVLGVLPNGMSESQLKSAYDNYLVVVGRTS